MVSRQYWQNERSWISICVILILSSSILDSNWWKWDHHVIYFWLSNVTVAFPRSFEAIYYIGLSDNRHRNGWYRTAGPGRFKHRGHLGRLRHLLCRDAVDPAHAVLFCGAAGRLNYIMQIPPATATNEQPLYHFLEASTLNCLAILTRVTYISSCCDIDSIQVIMPLFKHKEKKEKDSSARPDLLQPSNGPGQTLQRPNVSFINNDSAYYSNSNASSEDPRLRDAPSANQHARPGTTVTTTTTTTTSEWREQMND